MKLELLREIRDDVRHGQSAGPEAGRDTYDLASDERDREISSLLSDRDRGKLQTLEDALDRIDDGTFGICEECEGEIALGRLEVMPFSLLCVSCQTEQERSSRLAVCA